VIDLEDDDPDVIQNMVRFLYTGSYSDGRDAEESSTTAGTTNSPPKGPFPSVPVLSNAMSNIIRTGLLMNTMMYVIGDKYDIQALKDLARKYEEAVPDRWNSASFDAGLNLPYGGDYGHGSCF
jgi:hypothetical protein